MPTQTYSLEPNAPKRLTVSWNGLWKNFTVALDGQPVMTVENKKALDAGQEVTLPDGSTLFVQFKTSFGGGGLELTRDGQPLPGTAGDPSTKVKTAAQILYLIAGLNVVLGAVTLAANVPFLAQLGFGGISIVVGFVLGVLGYFTMQHSRIALGIGLGIYGLDTIFTLVDSVSQSGTPGIGGIVMRFLFLSALVKGFAAMGQLKRGATAAQKAADQNGQTNGG